MDIHVRRFRRDILWSKHVAPQEISVSGTLSGHVSDMNVQATGIDALGRAGNKLAQAIHA